MLKKWNSLSLIVRICIGLAIGAVLGFKSHRAHLHRPGYRCSARITFPEPTGNTRTREAVRRSPESYRSDSGLYSRFVIAGQRQGRKYEAVPDSYLSVSLQYAVCSGSGGSGQLHTSGHHYTCRR